ncbi:hypothetical protein VMCG_04032 [Cytospora schulzeri]|uniref:Rhodopsin domain-containing protein n=1 Tax=Cytospora schulzeri TaxID=448051 RepID=A0A423WU80_9PEZI|nr:hypothetical protein VMCG_04032 [Valsa malicola]
MFVGIHDTDIPSYMNMARGLQWSYMMMVFYNPVLALVKCSVLSFLYRLAGHETATKWWIISVIAFTACQGIATLLVTIFQCGPIKYFWLSYGDNSTVQGHCIQQATFYVVTAALTILTDLVVLALPFYIFLGLQVTGKMKFMVICLFMLGGVVTIVSILRLVWLVQVGLAGPYGATSPDPTYDIRFVYSEIETCLAIITACGPSLRPLLARWFPKCFSTLDPASSRQYNLFDEGTTRLTSRSRSKPTRRSRKTVADQLAGSIPLKDMTSQTRTEIRTNSPTGSEEEMMTYHGIIRTMDFSVKYEVSGIGTSALGKGTRPDTIEGVTRPGW